jgi:glyoxylase-like metal-dependent hydrolase (beta-lactamase superfamily II)
MIKIKTFVFNAFQENSYILHDETDNCIIIDPGCSCSEEENELSGYIKSYGLKPIAMVNTHCHIDHILGCKFLKKSFDIPFYAHEGETILIRGAKEYGIFFGFEFEQPPMPDEYLTDNQEFRFGNSRLLISHVPGHSPGSITLYNQTDKFVLTGDVLFRGSVGRTDLPGGDFNILISSIKKKLLTLPQDVVVFPGHGPYTTIGQENDSNPFINNKS